MTVVKYFLVELNHITRTISIQVRRQSEAELIQNPSPFCNCCTCEFLCNSNKKNTDLRLTFKEKVYELGEKRNYSRGKIIKLLKFKSEYVTVRYGSKKTGQK
jgi:hypothetical protein